MIKLPSVQNLTGAIQRVVQRLPWVVLVAAAKAILLIILIETPRTDEATHNLLVRLIFLLFLALPLLLTVRLVGERRHWSHTVQLGAVAGIVALLIGYFFTINETPIQRDYYRFGLFMAAAHLLVSFAPFIGYREQQGFWEYNKTLFLQILSATLYAGTLYIGLIIAIETVHFLFDVDYPFRIEADLFVLIFSFVHTILFLSGLPERLDTLEENLEYPKGLKLFTQYVLLPLEVVYLIILYVYSAKILAQWQLPEGGVAYLVVAFSVAGILALLLLYPLRDSAEERWIQLFTRRFHLALLPLIVLLFIGIFRRIRDYGITENRYLVGILAVWLLGITIYFLFSKRDDIRLIPLTLCLISLLIAVGPWSIFGVSRQSQANRFRDILAQYQLLNGQQQVEGKAAVPPSDYDHLLSIVRYFRDRGEIQTLQPFFAQLPTRNNQTTVANAIELRLRNSLTAKAVPGEGSRTLNFSSRSALNDVYALDIKGFEQLWMFQVYGEQRIEQGGWMVQPVQNGRTLNIYQGSTRITSWDIATRLAELEQEYGTSSHEVDPARLRFDFQNQTHSLRLVLRSASRNGNNYSYEGILLWR
ncbi:DUF4153 domain-containing protein [Telluribacter sp. SYSU D00476]|uniref:DUF4153 domain-containing protein n=1 Tax=Telluribacter sp. SYSU D00476 TaxID=2811430 RepID=UPI001FF100BA|nr:DUF4153 domain-containing protein [Telluribacter sp. SYSU D00476]